jgi:hypothetical protein
MYANTLAKKKIETINCTQTKATNKETPVDRHR